MLWKCKLDPDTNVNTNDMYIWKALLRGIYGPIQDKGCWAYGGNIEIYNLYKDINMVHGMGFVCCVTRVEDERISKYEMQIS